MDTSLLTPKQKRANHIASEQRRRQAIREAFDLITGVVPNLDQRESRSEAIVLTRTVDYLLKLAKENEQLVDALSSASEDQENTGEPKSLQDAHIKLEDDPIPVASRQTYKSKVPIELRADYDKDLVTSVGNSANV